MSRARASTHELRSAIDALPRATRAAMLEGVRSNKIIAGAYVDRQGGVCPMLAAHRQGARTAFLPFSRAWDRFSQGKRARRASRRELHVLVAHLQASLLAEEGDVDLGEAIAEHRSLAARTRIERARSRREHSGRARSRRAQPRVDAQIALEAGLAGQAPADAVLAWAATVRPVDERAVPAPA